MKQIRKISKVLFYVTRTIAFLYVLTSIFGFVSFAFKTQNFELTKDAASFQINFPFSHTPFLVGQNNPSAIWEMILGILIYSLFFWLLSNVFNAFEQPKLFTEKNVKTLQIFYIANFIIPILMLIFLVINQNFSTSFWSVALLHILLGVFIYFMTIIFKQGLHLQNEQDLYI
jgi:hypothetical protein